ncbi:MAG: hypothetical protein GJ676_02135 [Rhodobacteraceae bacterium]|nr:hypothetical protein [Paracoccaceae bacterium]
MNWLKALAVALSVALAGTAQAQNLAEANPHPVGVNLSGITDWSTQQPFIDVFKTARSWIGHLPRQWGGASHEDLASAGYLDDDGWPTAKPPELGSIGTVILNDLPEEAMDLAGRYRLRFDGNGIVEVAGRGTNVRYGKGEVTFDFTPGPGAVDIRIQRTDRARTGDYVRNITVVKLDNVQAYEAGEIFNPLWLDRMSGFASIRHVNWMRANGSTHRTWEDRSRPDDYTWSRGGAPLEILLALSNKLNADPWFTLPHGADDDYVTRFAEAVKAGLEPGLKAYVEYSNEVWNWQFQQAHYANEQAQERWGTSDNWMQYYAARSIEVAKIWDAVFADEADQRLVQVISSQTGWLGLEEQVFDAPLWRGEEPGRPSPSSHFDAYAITGYFGRGLGTEHFAEMVRGWLQQSLTDAQSAADAQGLTGEARETFVAAHKYDTANGLAWEELLDGMISGDNDDTIESFLNKYLSYHMTVAQAQGLDLIAYEGGTHLAGVGPIVDDEELTAFFIQFNYTPEMALLYEELLAGWFASGAGLFMAYSDVRNPTRWGSWGALRYLSDDNPRWDALEAAK